MLAERAGLEVDQAFVRLRDHARSHNLSLHDLAQDLVDGNVVLESLNSPRPSAPA